MQEILINLVSISPVVAVLIWVIIYFKKEIETKNSEIKELNLSLRDVQKESLLSINKMIDVVKDLKELIKEKLK
jgi:hypothetical protein